MFSLSTSLFINVHVVLQKDLSSWLHQIGLQEYKPNFRRNQIKTVRDMEALKSFTIKEINEDLNITKPGKEQLFVNKLFIKRKSFD